MASWDPTQVPEGLLKDLTTFNALLPSAKEGGYIEGMLVDLLKSITAALSGDLVPILRAKYDSERTTAFSAASADEEAAARFQQTQKNVVDPMMHEVGRVFAQLQELSQGLSEAAAVRMQSAMQKRQQATYNQHQLVRQRFELASAITSRLPIIRQHLGTAFEQDLQERCSTVEKSLCNLQGPVPEPGPAVPVPDGQRFSVDAVMQRLSLAVHTLNTTAAAVGVMQDPTMAPSSTSGRSSDGSKHSTPHSAAGASQQLAAAAQHGIPPAMVAASGLGSCGQPPAVTPLSQRLDPNQQYPPPSVPMTEIVNPTSSEGYRQS